MDKTTQAANLSWMRRWYKNCIVIIVIVESKSIGCINTSGDRLKWKRSAGHVEMVINDRNYNDSNVELWQTLSNYKHPFLFFLWYWRHICQIDLSIIRMMRTKQPREFICFFLNNFNGEWFLNINIFLNRRPDLKLSKKRDVFSRYF